MKLLRKVCRGSHVAPWVTFGAVLVIPGWRALGQSPEPRVVKFEGGSAVITRGDGYESVVMKAADGTETGSSVCGNPAGTYDEIVPFAKTVLELVTADNHEAIADLASYPLRINLPGSKPQFLKDKKEFLARYAEVFTSPVLQRASWAQPDYVFCHDDMAMVAWGVMWIQKDHAGKLRIVVINVVGP
jgi:hypothetical protein